MERYKPHYEPHFTPIPAPKGTGGGGSFIRLGSKGDGSVVVIIEATLIGASVAAIAVVAFTLFAFYHLVLFCDSAISFSRDHTNATLLSIVIVGAISGVAALIYKLFKSSKDERFV